MICQRLNDGKDDEYLVDGAVLSCTSAKWGEFKLSDGSSVQLDVARGKRKEGVPTVFLRVRENPLTESESGSYHYATVADAVKFQNITPFLCNCCEPANSEQEQKIKENMDECRKHGVCQYLMDLEEEWENIDFGVEYESFFNLGIETKFGCTSYIEGQKVTSEEESKAGIIKTSVLFCKHGGFIYPVDSGQKKIYALACTVYGDHKGGLQEEQQKANAEYIYNFLKKQGWTVEAICGVLGNMQKESSMNPGAWQYWENQSYGFGLAQWSESKEFLEFAHLDTVQASELSERSPQKMMDAQLDYLMKSLNADTDGVECRWLVPADEKYYKFPLSDDDLKNMTVKEFSQSTDDYKELAMVFHASYERSGDDKDGIQKRVDYAETWYLYFTEGVWKGL